MKINYRKVRTMLWDRDKKWRMVASALKISPQLMHTALKPPATLAKIRRLVDGLNAVGIKCTAKDILLWETADERE